MPVRDYVTLDRYRDWKNGWKVVGKEEGIVSEVLSRVFSWDAAWLRQAGHSLKDDVRAAARVVLRPRGMEMLLFLSTMAGLKAHLSQSTFLRLNSRLSHNWNLHAHGAHLPCFVTHRKCLQEKRIWYYGLQGNAFQSYNPVRNQFSSKENMKYLCNNPYRVLCVCACGYTYAWVCMCVFVRMCMWVKVKTQIDWI